MKNYPFSFEQLKKFSESTPYLSLGSDIEKLYHELKDKEVSLNFPAIRDDVGSFINFIFKFYKPKNIFEFGSGYGQSAFWYLLNNSSVESITLTEKRDDLLSVFENLSWPKEWKEKLHYFQDDAFKVFADIDNLDFILIDGVKADYLEFLKASFEKLNTGALVLIDNSYWRGSFLDDEVVLKKKTAKNIRDLHFYIKDTDQYESIFLPFEDGVSLLRKK